MYDRVKVAQEERAKKTKQAKAESDLMNLLYCYICGNDSKTTQKGICKNCRKAIASDSRKTHFYEY